MFAQVVGEKYFRLYGPDQTEKVYPHRESLLGNTSQVDVEDPDLEMFPEFEKAVGVECVVKEGEFLFIPVGGITSGL
ncbi:Lysine-specific demethylase 8 [Phlyctochytrium planicorne]|nr:Lysine-specific demethylase 8 [Phlyctochytrium planicorne]